MGETTGTLGLVGLHGGEWFGRAAGEALRSASVLIGDPRHLDALGDDLDGRREKLASPLSDGLERIAALLSEGEQVCLVVSGDPGFFGLARLARARFGPAVHIHPAPSSVALAFARVGVEWDDAVVVSAHGRQGGIERAVDAAGIHPKVAVLTSPSDPPQRLGQALLDARTGARTVHVASRLGAADETVWTGDIAGLAAGRFDGLSVVVLLSPGPVASAAEPGISWGLPDGSFEHRGGMITKAEARAVALGKLALPAAGVMWDVGAGSGSVSAECCRLVPGLRVFAVERQAEDAARARRNLSATLATVIEGEAPAALAALPDPDRAFVGGGGERVLDEVIERLRPGGTIVATYAILERAVHAGNRLGNLIQLSVSRGVPAGEGGPLRLQAENPVFIAWGRP